jgi:hypothetical protein
VSHALKKRPVGAFFLDSPTLRRKWPLGLAGRRGQDLNGFEHFAMEWGMILVGHVGKRDPRGPAILVA